jgi:signal transduction histidine kinase
MNRSGYFAELFDPSSYKHLLYFLTSWLIPCGLFYGIKLIFDSWRLYPQQRDSNVLFDLVNQFPVITSSPKPSLQTAWLLILVGFAILVLLIPVATWIGLQLVRFERWRIRVLLNANIINSVPFKHSNAISWWRYEFFTLKTFRTNAYLLLHFAFAISTLFVLGSMLYLTGFLFFAPAIAVWQPVSNTFSFWRDSILWTGSIGLKFSALSSGFAFVAGIPMLVLTLQTSNAVAKLWRVTAENVLSSDNQSQQIIKTLELAGKSVLEDNTNTAIDTILNQGVRVSNATGASIGNQTFSLNTNQIENPNGKIIRLELEQNTQMQVVFNNAPPTPRDTHLWNALATHANTALRLKHLIDRERSDASEQERQRIARELHDSVAQALYGISLGTRSALEQLETNPENAKQALIYAIDLADGGTSEMKTLLFALRPDALEEGGLAAALHKLGEMLKSRYKLESIITAHLEPDVTLEVKGALYRIAQEAVHNTVKHAKAKLVSIKLENHLLEVSDNGQGFDVNTTRAGALGLKSMRERSESINANFEITSSNAGTRILVNFGGKS